MFSELLRMKLKWLLYSKTTIWLDQYLISCIPKNRRTNLEILVGDWHFLFREVPSVCLLICTPIVDMCPPIDIYPLGDTTLELFPWVWSFFLAKLDLWHQKITVSEIYRRTVRVQINTSERSLRLEIYHSVNFRYHCRLFLIHLPTWNNTFALC